MPQTEHQITVDVAGEVGGDLTVAAVEQLVLCALDQVQLPPGEAEADVSFVEPRDIAALNETHLGVKGPTDVLSFPIDGLDELQGNQPRALGSIVVCTSYVQQQLEAGTTMSPSGAESGDSTLGEAIARCVVHGALHLCGFDHERSEADAAQMFAREQRALDAFWGNR